MANFPILLKGNSLGERHKHLNKLVNDAFKNNIPFNEIQATPEQSAVDRLFKIDLAAKHKNIDYIIQNLKDDDMLYVSRALKCTWLVKDETYSIIVNPANLEQIVYPEMRTNATNKMKQWIQHHLKDEHMNKVFYEYYKNIDLNYALKFLPKCPVDFFIEEMKLVPVGKIKPQLLKLLCERSTKAAEIYFKHLIKAGKVDENYITKMQFILKTDPELYFTIIENFFAKGFKRINKEATKYIMNSHRNRFDAKPELYVARILDLPTVAKFLNNDQTKELIIKLAKAKYIDERSWFTYEFAKPLIKQIDSTERSKFCTKIFTQKDFGEPIKEPPYLIPPAKENKTDSTDDVSKILDKDHEDYDATLRGPPKSQLCCGRGEGSGGFKMRTDLDKLYDEYRFKSFETTLTELRKKIRKESNMTMRQNMMLVLVSKTGGRTESVELLLRYLIEKHLNETVNIRAAVIRSFVKRAFAWRWPITLWNLLQQFAGDLCLDGNFSAVECKEGLQAVLLRHLLLDEPLSLTAWTAIMKINSDLTEFKLNSAERKVLHERLPAMLLSTPTHDPESTFKKLTQVCDLLDAYKIKIENYPGIVNAAAAFYQEHPAHAEKLLLRLFKARVARKLLFVENFKINHSNASYLNALKQDTSVFTEEQFKHLLDDITLLNHNEFLVKLAIYFGENDGLATRLMKALERKATEQPHVKLARPMALLTGSHYINWPNITAPNDDKQTLKYREMLASLQANALHGRNKLPLPLQSKHVSLAALANWIHTCSPKALRNGIETFKAFPRHARLVLALRGPTSPGLIADLIPSASQCRPMRTLRLVLRLLRKYPEKFLAQDFEAFKTIVTTTSLKKKTFAVHCELARLNKIPKRFRLEYAMSLYHNLVKIGFGPDEDCQTQIYYRIAVPLIMCFKNHIEEINVDDATAILKQYLKRDFTPENITRFENSDMDEVIRFKNFHLNWDLRLYNKTFMKLIGRFVITAKTYEDSKNRLREIYDPFETKIKAMWHIEDVNYNSTFWSGYFVNFLESLQYSKVFYSETDHSLPAIDRICAFGDDIAPIVENFLLNQRIRFVSLYRKAVKQCMMEYEGLNKTVNSQAVFVTMGKIVADDIEDMVLKLFPSIRLLYSFALKSYMPTYHHQHLIRGLLDDASKPNAILLGLYLANNEIFQHNSRFFDSKLVELINGTIKKSQVEEIKYFAYSKLDSTFCTNFNCMY